MQTQAATRPRFRQDLVAEPIEDEGQRFIDVIDPDTGAAFRFYEVEYSLACAMDGERDVTKLVSWAQEELGVTPTPNELLSVIATLGDLGYLDRAVPLDGDLAAGVVAAKPAPPPRTGIDVELGVAGAPKGGPTPHAMAADRDRDLLGPAGAKPVPPPLAPVPQVMSEDLSDQMAIRVDDVKEAVRASKVMRSVDLPPELQSALDSAETPPPIVEPPRTVTPPQQPYRPPQPSISTPTPVQTPRTQPLPPQPQPQPIKVTPVPPMDESRTSPILIVLLVLVILGGGAFALWKYVLSKDDTATTTGGTTTPPVGSAGSAGIATTPPPPPPPPPITGTIELVAPAPVDVTASVGGSIDMIVEDGTSVAIGDRIAKLDGAEKWESKLRTATFQVNRKTRDVAEAKNRLEQAQKDGKQREISARQAALTDNEESLAKYSQDKSKAETELAKFTLSAPVAGSIKLATSKGKRVGADDVVAQIIAAAVPTVTFDLPPTRKLSADQPVKVIVAEGTKLDCSVAAIEGTKAMVRCPADGAPAAGTKVTLE